MQEQKKAELNEQNICAGMLVVGLKRKQNSDEEMPSLGNATL